MDANVQLLNVWMPYYDVRIEQNVSLQNALYHNIICSCHAPSTSKVNNQGHWCVGHHVQGSRVFVIEG